jgi:hypothetical protein
MSMAVGGSPISATTVAYLGDNDKVATVLHPHSRQEAALDQDIRVNLAQFVISGTPRSFLNLDSRCPTSIEAIVIGGGLDNPLPKFWVGLVSMNMLSSLSVVARRSSARHSNSGGARGIVPNPGSGAQRRDMRDWDDWALGNKLVHGYRSW